MKHLLSVLPPGCPLPHAGAPPELARARSFIGKWLSIYHSFNGHKLTEAPEGTYRLLNKRGSDDTVSRFSLHRVTAIDHPAPLRAVDQRDPARAREL